VAYKTQVPQEWYGVAAGVMEYEERIVALIGAIEHVSAEVASAYRTTIHANTTKAGKSETYRWQTWSNVSTAYRYISLGHGRWRLCIGRPGGRHSSYAR
jgi:hypothetical protein